MLKKNYYAKGISLTELVIVLIILGLLTIIGVPTFHNYIHHQNLKNDTESLRQLAILSEKDALIYEHPIILCPTSDNQSCSSSPYSFGLMAFIDNNDDAKLSNPDQIIGTLDFSGNNNRVTYKGFPYPKMQVFSPNSRISSNGTFWIGGMENTKEIYFVRINKSGVIQAGQLA